MTTKSRKIEGLAEITRIDSACIGLCRMETMFIEIDYCGETLRWWSDTVEPTVIDYKLDTGRNLDKTKHVHISAFVRKSTGRLFNVKIEEVYFDLFVSSNNSSNERKQ